MGGVEFLVVISFVITAIFGIKYLIFINRRNSLLETYSDESLVHRLMMRDVWQGMSLEQLIDSRGQPADKSIRVLKTKTVETFKYDQVGKNRFGLRVTVENGVVVGWESQ